MESQGERVPGVLGMDEELLESMVKDGNPEQDTPEQDINVQEQFPPPFEPRARNGRGSGRGV